MLGYQLMSLCRLVWVTIIVKISWDQIPIIYRRHYLALDTLASGFYNPPALSVMFPVP